MHNSLSQSTLRRTLAVLFTATILSRAGGAEPVRNPGQAARSFAERNSPENIEAVAKNFLDLINFWVPTRGHGNPRVSLEEARELRNDGRHTEALEVFYAYFLGKLRNPQAFGLTAWDVHPSSGGIAGRWSYPFRSLPADPDVAAADRLLEGFWGEVEIGPPGQVNWLHPHTSRKDMNLAQGALPSPPLLLGTAFNALPAAYLATGDEKYMRAWVAYMDDWAMNSTISAEYPHPSMVPSNVRGSHELIKMMRMLGGLSLAMPYERQAELLPPATLARILDKYWNELILFQALYMRTNTHNWTPGAQYMLLALLFDEFKAAPLIFREGRRRTVEDNAVTQNLRDGSENQQCPWYNSNYIAGVGQVFPLLEARARVPAWQEMPWVAELKDDPDWFQEIREHMFARISYQLRLRTPQGSWPVGVRGTDMRQGGSHAFHHSPEAFADPELRRIRLAMADATRPANERLITPDSGVRPSYHSEWFPYGGYNLVREGWEADSGYGHMFTSPAPGSYGGRRSRSNNNFFGLAAFGQDLIVEEKWDRYGLMDSPIRVDGLPQDFHAGTTRAPMLAGHKMTPAVAWTEPGYWRWHASDHFNLMEGVYEGPYAKTDSLHLRAPEVPVTLQRGGAPLDQALLGIRHQRWVHFVRDARLWIVTDRMQGAGEHAYTQYWNLPSNFKEDEIEVSPEDRRVRTASEASFSVRNVDIPQANVSMHAFSTEELGYRSVGRQRERKPSIVLDWKGKDDSLVVTAIYPRAPELGIEADIAPRQIEGAGGAVGFEVELPGGGRVRYLAVPGDTPAVLELGKVRATAVSILVTDTGGIVMGCKAFAFDGRSLSVQHPDFEFSTLNPDEGLLKMVPIYRPIAPVEIGPARNVFVDQVEVTMTSKTPDVEIRYTLDGSEPTPQSSLYEGPFMLRHNAVVKARAYRPGMTKNPPHTSGTHATATSRAVFDKVFPARAVAVGRPKPGLTARYFEGDWRRLWLRLDSLEPVAQTSGVEVFDLSVVPESNPPLGDVPAPRAKFFAVEYTGYLDVPEAGVYTLHAPREYVMPDIDPGYELRIFLGNKLGVHGWDARIQGMHEWYPATRLHAQGNWSVALEKGLQPIRIVYLDYRTDAPARLNQKGLADYIWSGVTPDLKISGPGMEPQPIPSAWFKH